MINWELLNSESGYRHRNAVHISDKILDVILRVGEVAFDKTIIIM